MEECTQPKEALIGHFLMFTHTDVHAAGNKHKMKENTTTLNEIEFEIEIPNFQRFPVSKSGTKFLLRLVF